jgi:hypothetical protein
MPEVGDDEAKIINTDRIDDEEDKIDLIRGDQDGRML